MPNFGAVIGVGIVAILMIIVANMLGLPHHMIMGMILTAVSILLFLVAGAIFSHSWIFGLIVGGIAVALLLYAMHEFSITEPAKQGLLLPTIDQLLL